MAVVQKRLKFVLDDNAGSATEPRLSICSVLLAGLKATGEIPAGHDIGPMDVHYRWKKKELTVWVDLPSGGKA